MADKKALGLTEQALETGIIKHFQALKYITEEQALEIIKVIREKIELEE